MERTLGLLNTTWSGESWAIARIVWMPVIPLVHREPKPASGARLVIIRMSQDTPFPPPSPTKAAAGSAAGAETCAGRCALEHTECPED